MLIIHIFIKYLEKNHELIFDFCPKTKLKKIINLVKTKKEQ